MNKAIQIIVSGKVQGVFFRKHTCQKAKELGIKGFVANLKDGNVKIIAQGNDDKLTELVDWCRKGSPGAVVENVEVNEFGSHHHYSGFEIHYV